MAMYDLHMTLAVHLFDYLFMDALLVLAFILGAWSPMGMSCEGVDGFNTGGYKLQEQMSSPCAVWA